MLIINLENGETQKIEAEQISVSDVGIHYFDLEKGWSVCVEFVKVKSYAIEQVVTEAMKKKSEAEQAKRRPNARTKLHNTS